MTDNKKREDGFYEEWDALLDTMIERSWESWRDNLVDMATAIQRYEVLTGLRPNDEGEKNE